MKSEPNYILYGVEGSYYAAKTRSYLKAKLIPFKEVLADRRAFVEQIIPRVGYPVVPVLVTPTNETLQDTSVIFDTLEKRHPTPPMIPSSPKVKIAAYLIELLADEWLKLPALHYRWHYDHEFATIMMGENNDPDAPIEKQRKIGEKIAARFSRWPAHLGATASTKEAVELHFLEFLDYLENHFCQHKFVLGDRVTMADFALMGPMYAHLYRDPYSGKILHWRAPRVCRWIENMKISQEKPGLAELPDDVPTTMIKILRHLNRDFVPTLVAAIELIQIWLKKNNHSAVPRYVGSHSFTIGRKTPYEVTGRRSLHPFEQWKIQRVKRVIAEVETQELEQTNCFLNEVEAFPIKTLKIRESLSIDDFCLSKKHCN